MKERHIFNMKMGLMGAVINNSNMGCVALTYSLVNMLHTICERESIEEEYVVFELCIDSDRVKMLGETLGIPLSKIQVVKYGAMGNLKDAVRYCYSNYRMLKAIKECDFIIDITAGDSFADIYGDYRFRSWTNIKWLVEEAGVPLILGPQTYGPFNKEKNREKAVRIINNAHTVISRDDMSAEYIRQFTDKEVIVTTDLAFSLPYEKKMPATKEKVKVGLNISGLLIKDKAEDTEIQFSMKTDYDAYIQKLAGYLAANDSFEVHLIPHVSDDMSAIHLMKDMFPSFIVHDAFDSPIKVKNCISGMDLFIGARMHATIAAFSSGVPTIPTAYSRKFRGVFECLDYPFVVDLQNLSTDEAFEMTQQFINRRGELKQSLEEAQSLVEQKTNKTVSCFRDLLHKWN